MRILLVLSLLCISLFAEPSGYIGISIEDSTEFFTLKGSDTINASAPQYKIKAGYGEISNFAVEAAFSYMDYSTNVFSSNDSAALMLDITLYKGWDMGYNLYPYLGVGIGMGAMKVERQLEDSLSFSSFNFGGGVRYGISQTYDFDIGVNYKLRTWQTISLVSEDVKVTSHLVNPYIGINYHF
ncbi:MAG: outer membrane beta-barrel protein [Helicobacteraceae bacterium]|jgi:opacity protein-like surface antigen|nr:outer membrane beta-barrel protein [Helicobacteraceae bacterium]